ncbi:MAG: ATP-dependent Clp protease proteolytic subunit [Oligoflexia bacterium]|nr:ATP-dependent Clp protease proteolytic subunit [Oligoflexia bacterium]
MRFPILLALASFLTLNPAARATPVVRLAEIRGGINPATASYLRSALTRAEAEDAQALLIELDTPGGLLSSVRDMAQAMDQARLPVIVFVTPAGASATSAGALLMLASHVAAMAPGTNIGAAHPVGPQGEDIQGDLGTKALNDTAAFARGLAEQHGRNRELADAIVARSRSLSAREALDQKLIELLATDRAELLSRLEGREVRLAQGRTHTLRLRGAELRPTEMSAGQRLLSLLAHPNIAAILMSLGIFLIYLELSNPGITLAGISGAICLLIALMSLQLLPIHAGGLALLLLGAALILAEPFIVSHGVLGVGGAISFALGLLWIMDRSSSSLRVSPEVWVPIALGLVSGVLLIAFAAARMKRLTRETLAKIGGGGLAGLAGYEGHVETVEPDGRSGRVAFRGELWAFRSEIPLKPGDAVRAIRSDGLVVEVTRR